MVAFKPELYKADKRLSQLVDQMGTTPQRLSLCFGGPAIQFE